MITLIGIVVLTFVAIIGSLYLMAAACYVLAAFVGMIAWIRDRLFPRRGPDLIEFWTPIASADRSAGIARITDPNATFKLDIDPPSAETIRQN